MKGTFVVAAFLGAFLFGAGAAFCASVCEKPDIDYDRTVLESGKLQTFTYECQLKDGGKKKRVVGVILIDAPPEMVWRALVDWESMPQFVSDLEYYKTLYRDPSFKDRSRQVSYIEGKLKVAFFSIIYNLKVVFDNQRFCQTWDLVDDDEAGRLRQEGVELGPSSSFLKDISGFGYIEPYGDGSRTVYYYAPQVEVSIPVPAWVERKIAESSLGEYMEGIKRKIEQQRKSMTGCDPSFSRIK